MPSAPSADVRAEVLSQWVLAREGAVRGWYLTSAGNAELLPEHIAMRLRGTGGDAKALADLFVRATGSDQRYDLALANGQTGWVILEDLRHGAELASGMAPAPLSKGRISSRYAR